MNAWRAGLRRVVSAALYLVFAAASVVAGDVEGPRGIFVLGSGGGDLRNIRDYRFVEGFSLRIGWDQVEKAEGVFDFSTVDDAVARLQAIGKKLTLEVFTLQPPAHVMARVGETWFNPKIGALVPVPWDAEAGRAWSEFSRALASHPVADASRDGAEVPFSDHPTLETVAAPIPGLLEIRELSGTLVSLASYERGCFIDSVAAAAHASRDAFAAKFGFVALFRMDDADRDVPLDRAVLERLMAEFNGPGQPTLGFFQETLSDVGPTPEGLGALLAAAAPETYVMFQALTSWSRPFTGHDKVASGHPGVGIALGHGTYGATYFELYVTDIDNPELTEELEGWNSRLTGHHPGEVRRRVGRAGSP